MKLTYNKIVNSISLRLKDDQIKTFVFLMIKSALVSICGFVFWILAARLYPDDIVGKGTIALSLLNTISQIARLGFDISAMKFIPEKKEQAPSIINLMFFATGIFAGIATIVAVIIAPYLNFYNAENAYVKILLILFSIFWAIYFLMDFIGISLYLYKITIIKNIIFLGLRFVFLGIFIFVKLPSAIIIVIGISELIAVLTTFIMFKKRIPNLKYSIKQAYRSIRQLKEMIFFSFDNYLADVLFKTVNYITPLIIGVILTEAAAGYFFISWQLTMIIYIIPGAISSSLLIQISYKSKNAQKRVTLSIFISMITSIVSIIIVAFAGRYILLLYGVSYADNAYFLLLLLSFTSSSYSYITIKVSELRHKSKTKIIILINLLLVGIYFASFVIFLNLNYHLDSFGIAWFIGTSIVALIIALTELFFFIKGKTRTIST